MNVFVLSPGRSGSLTFIRACEHITNYSAAHESRIGVVGPGRLDYPQRHIESDNRLSWFLGRLERAYGPEAYYVHLVRDRHAVAQSYARRADGGIMRGYRKDIYQGVPADVDSVRMAKDYVETVDDNIALFLKDKPLVMRFELETPVPGFASFWEWIGAEGDLQAALAEFDVHHNSSPSRPNASRTLRKKLARVPGKVGRILTRFPDFIRYA
jgi:hypothetical protein